MDWLRRNWPDLAIGIALVAVIAGIIATLLTGGSFFPLTPTQPAVTPTPPAVTEPAPPVAPEALPEAAPEVTPEVTPEVEAAPEPDGPSPEPLQPGVAVLAPDGSPADEPVPTDEPVAEPPPPPPSDEIAEAPAEPVAPTPTEPAAPAAPPSDPAPVVVAPAPAPAPAPTAPLPSAATDPEAPFRVSVGAFGNPDNAARQADTFRSAGYPVFTGTQGDLTIVLVGPYQAEADAAAVAARIRAGGFGVAPVIYRFQPDATAAASSTPAPSAPAEPPPAEPPPAATPAAEPTPTPAALPAAAPSATVGRYLQVGAFASAQSAQPLRAQLEGLGFAASEVVEDGLVKLLVGPFDEASMSAARQRLEAQGIQNFPR